MKSTIDAEALYQVLLESLRKRLASPDLLKQPAMILRKARRSESSDASPRPQNSLSEGLQVSIFTC